MKLKIPICAIILVVIVSNFVVAMNNKNISISNDDTEWSINNYNVKTQYIKVAILTGDKLIISRAPYFIEMLTDYQWIVGSNLYRFVVDPIIDDDILKGKLNTDNYDVIVVPGGGVGDGEALVRCYPSLENIKWKSNFETFIKDGGGYFSVCGGTSLITDLDLDTKPKSYLEFAYEKSSLGVSCIKSHYGTIANPLLCQLIGLPPEYPGVNTYCMYSGFNLSDLNISHYTGICLDCQIDTDNPIFDDYLESTRKIRWISGPSLVVPQQPDREVKVLARYPLEEISENESTRIHAWKYTGGISGMSKGFIKSIKNKYDSAFANKLADVYAFADDWDCTETIIETDYSNKPAITSEIYPNMNKARIVLSGPHTENNVWWGGYIQEVEDNSENNLWDALHRWVDINPNSKDLEWEYNYWMNRRIVAWASKKVPDNDLPPVYDSSQVCDIYPYEQSSNFTIIGNVEPSNDSFSLELYYRYSRDNLSWNEWISYGQSNEESAWEFYPSVINGAGYYQFYSIRTVEYEHSWEIERPPPGPDAIVHVIMAR